MVGVSPGSEAPRAVVAGPLGLSAFTSASYTFVSLSAVSFPLPILNSNSSSGFCLLCVLVIHTRMATNWFLRELKCFSVLGWSVCSYPVARLTSTPSQRGLMQEGEKCFVDQQREVVKFSTICVACERVGVAEPYSWSKLEQVYLVMVCNALLRQEHALLVSVSQHSSARGSQQTRF